MLTFQNKRGDEIFLQGVEDEMQLPFIRASMSAGILIPSSSGRLKSDIKDVAILIYNQEKFSNIYHSRICEDKSTLAWFLCAVHRRSAPQKTSRERSTSGASSNGSIISNLSTSPKRQPIPLRDVNVEATAAALACQQDPAKRGKTCELPRLNHKHALPCVYWAGLWYASVAEIKFLYNDLKTRFGNNFEHGNAVLHECGPDGSYMRPFTVYDLADLLERCWRDLMSSTLIAALDFRVKQHAALQSLGRVPNMSEIFAAQGLINIDRASPDHIFRMLREVHSHEVRKAVKDNVKDDERLIGGRSAMRSHSPRVQYGIDPKTTNCLCPPFCICRAVCDFSRSGCKCAIDHHRMAGAAKVQRQRAPTSTTNEENEYATGSRNATLTRENLERHEFGDQYYEEDTRRGRSPTKASELLLPSIPKTPARGAKDAIPLGFYGDNSGQRYPAEARMRSNVPAPVYGSSFYTTNIPERKAVPLPPSPSDDSFFQSLVIRADHDTATTTENTTDTSPVTRPCSLDDDFRTMRPAVATQSLPSSTMPADYSLPYHKLIERFERPQRSNIRGLTYNNTPSWQMDSLPSPTYPTFQGFARENSAGPHTPAEGFPPMEGVPTGNRPFTMVFPDLIEDPNQRARAMTAATEAYDPLDKPLPKPDPLNPRPATKQRYVSAGGNTPLHERPEIFDFKLPTGDLEAYNMTKHELFTSLGDKELSEHQAGLARARLSGGKEQGQGAGRERGSTGSSRGEKFKRMFLSRKNSECE